MRSLSRLIQLDLLRTLTVVLFLESQMSPSGIAVNWSVVARLGSFPPRDAAFLLGGKVPVVAVNEFLAEDFEQGPDDMLEQETA